MMSLNVVIALPSMQLRKLSNFIKNILICFTKMNEDLKFFYDIIVSNK